MQDDAVGRVRADAQALQADTADVTRALIERRGFTIVAVEADWPDAYRANRQARTPGEDETAEAALAHVTRFPRWMWRNREAVRFLRWLRGYNADQYFVAEQNARVIKDAEAYYRAMVRGGAESWNLRDRHMMSTLEYTVITASAGPLRGLRIVAGRERECAAAASNAAA